MPVVWRARALADIARIARYIAEDNPVAAGRIAHNLLLAGDSLVIFPRRGRPGRLPGTRELVVMPPYIVVYRVSITDAVTILRVWHARGIVEQRHVPISLHRLFRHGPSRSCQDERGLNADAS